MATEDDPRGCYKLLVIPLLVTVIGGVAVLYLQINIDRKDPVKMGVNYLDRNEIDKAIREFDEAIKSDPNNAEAYFYRGSAYWQKTHYENAIEDFNQAIKLKVSYLSVYMLRGDAYVKIGKPKIAIDDFNRLIRLFPGNPSYLVARGDAYLAMRDYDSAMADYDKALSLQEKPHIPALRGKGLTHLGKGQLVEAIKAFDGVLSVAPDDIVAYVNRGDAYASIGHEDLAIHDYGKAINKNAAYMQAYYARARVYYTQKEFDLAIKDLTKCIEAGYNAYVLRGYCHYGKDKPGDAIQDFNDGIHRDSNDPEAHSARGFVYAATGKNEEASKSFQTVSRINPNYPFDLFKLAMQNCRKSNPKLSIQIITLFIKVNPGNLFSLHQRARCYINDEQYDNALEDAKAALKITTDVPETYNILGIVWQHKKDLGQAFLYYDEAIKKSNNQHAIAIYNKACILALQGNKTEALINLELALQTGYQDLSSIEKDSDLDSIRNTQRYKEIIAKFKKP